jgi:F-type H+-transporting ATPase subunit alpha
MPKAINNLKSVDREIGHIVSFFSGVAKIQGLPHVFLHEVLVTEKGVSAAVVIGFNERFVEAIFFDDNFNTEESLYRSQKIFQVLQSEKYIGRVVDGLGNPIDGLGEITGNESTVFQQAPPIIDRSLVVVPFSTGIKIIDACLPLGRGQRELIIGDRKLGKTSVALDILLNQRDAERPVYCVYVVCGQKEEDVRELIAVFKKQNAFLYSTIVVAAANASFAELYLAPFVGCTIAEYFRDTGKDALIIYDDLSKHAKAYRSISLLLDRAPGREAYPGDIFSLHAGLLERSAQLSKEKGSGSLTSLPIVETQEDDITSFIPTNIISITDGQIYLGRNLFQKGFLPAVNIGLSVSRIGSQAQPKLLAGVAGGIRLALSQHQELQKISQLETNLSAESELKIKRGDILLEILKQGKRVNVPWPQQVILFYSINQGFFDDIESGAVSALSTYLVDMLGSHYGEILTRIRQGVFDEDIKSRVSVIVKESKTKFVQ